MSKNNPASLASLRMPDFSGSWWHYRDSDTTTIRIGKFTPVTVREIPGGSLFKMKPELRIESLPMLAPLYNGFTLETKYVFAPYRLYISKLRKNRQLEWGQIPLLKLPRLLLKNAGVHYATDNFALNCYNVNVLPGSIFERLGMFDGCITSDFSWKSFALNAPKPVSIDISNTVGGVNCTPWLAYIDTWLRTEYNPQDEIIPVDVDIYINYDLESHGRTYITDFGVKYDSLRDIVDAFSYGERNNTSNGELMYFSPSDNQLVVDTADTLYDVFTTLFTELLPSDCYVQSCFSYFGVPRTVYNLIGMPLALKDVYNNSYFNRVVSGAGLLPVTYKGDYFSSWFSEDGISRLQSYVVNNGETLLSLRRKNSEMLIDLLGMVSGERWIDYLQYVFDQNLELKDHPIIVGYDRLDFGSIDVLSTADTGVNSQPGSTSVLGASASKVRNREHRVANVSFKSKEPGVLLTICKLIPNVVYYQGYPRARFYETIADLWHTQYQQKGFDMVMRQEFLSPFAIPIMNSRHVTFDGPFAATPEQTTDTATQGAVWVPLGWEYMSTYDRCNAGMRMPWFSPWLMKRDFTYYGHDARYGPNHVVTENPFDPDFSDYISTYIDGTQYNSMFSNDNRYDCENFILKISYDMSIYQPLKHQIINSHI